MHGGSSQPTDDMDETLTRPGTIYLESAIPYEVVLGLRSPWTFC